MRSTPSSVPPDVFTLPVPALVDMFIGVAEVMRPPVRVVIDSHLVTSVPMVIEGDGIHPDLFIDPVLEPHIAAGRLAFVAVMPDSAEHMARNSIDRGRGVGAAAVCPQAAGAYAFGTWLESRCQVLGIPVVRSRPFATLPDRIVDAVATGVARNT